MTVLSSRIIPDLENQIEKSRSMSNESKIPVSLPGVLGRKYPNAGREWKWQYLFPSGNAAVDPITGVVLRHHLHRSGIQRAMRNAVRSSGIAKHASIHTLRHSFATNNRNLDFKPFQELSRNSISVSISPNIYARN
ncbi:MAG: tyrosine-type recombinase/integrase [Candidatus Aegiribacteria sp.]|nr:tyrosine-type recombinase/integrase [Candidatus Aegiribacteria sp.]